MASIALDETSVYTEMFKQPGLEGLLPLLTLTRNGKRPEVVDEVIDGLKSAQKIDLLPVAYMLASLVFEKGNDREWLKRRFTMFEEILEDTWAYQEIQEKGREKGRQEGRLEEGQEIVMAFIEEYFPGLTPLAKQKVQTVKDAKALQKIVLTMIPMRTEQEVEEYLLTLKGDAAER
ncbi:MAG: hypothetical protein M3Z24_15150 [Chloroflexota bacterium]|nr:hypothetical protein [Chloroflexota bacterium]